MASIGVMPVARAGVRASAEVFSRVQGLYGSVLFPDVATTDPSTPLEPTGSVEKRAIGPYLVEALMGEGGTGRVFRCTHALEGFLAALKVPLGSGPDEREALRREIAALGRLSAKKQATGIVRLLEHGVETGMPWYAMEYVDGRDLRAFCDELWAEHSTLLVTSSTQGEGAAITRTTTVGVAQTQPAVPRSDVRTPVEAHAEEQHAVAPVQLRPAAGGHPKRVLRLIAELADALEQVHSQGVVHGDVTPKNVLVRWEDSTPVLIDFGTSFRSFQPDIAREVAEAHSALRATPGYMAPELIGGHAFDARADLYSLGCILYELLTGERPFRAAQTSDLLKQHQHSPAQPPSLCAANVPLELDLLVLRLLAKNPAERSGQARDVARQLRALAGEPLGTASSGSGPSLALYRPRLAGRSVALRQILERVSGSEGGAGQLVLLGGESGIGKTRLANEAAAALHAQGTLVLSGQCSQTLLDAPNTGIVGRDLEPLLPVLAYAADHALRFGPEFLASVGDALAALTPYAPQILAGLVLPALPGPLSPQLARSRVLRSMEHLLAEVCARQPLLMLLDDLQWADELTLEFLSGGHFRGPRGPTILGTYRSEETSPTLVTVAQGAELHLVLERLAAPALQAMLRDLLGSAAVPTGLLEFIQHHSEGNPLFAAEYLRAALSRDLLRANAAGEWRFDAPAAFSTPRSLGDLLALRVAGLSPRALSTLELACVMSREFDVRTLEALPNAAPLTDAGALEELVARQIIEWMAPGRYRFAHDKLREAQEQALSPGSRRQLHRLAAERLEQIAGSEVVTDAVLGFHWAQADEPRLALPYLESAAKEASASYAHARAAELYKLALQQTDLLQDAGTTASLERRAALDEALGDALVIGARHEEARAAFAGAARQLGTEQRLARARVFRKTAASYWTVHDYVNAESSLNAAAAALGQPDPDDTDANREFIEIEIGRFEQLYFSRRVGEETRQLLKNLQPVLDRHGSPGQRCFFYVAAASELAAQSRYEFSPTAVSLSRQALADLADVPLDQQCLARFHLGFLLFAGSESDGREAVSCFHEAAEDATELGNATLLSRTLLYHSMALVRLGDVLEAEAVARRGQLAAEAAQLTPYSAAAMAVLAWSAWRANQRVNARNLAEAARATWLIHAHAFPFRWVCAFPLMDLYLADERFEAIVPLLAELLETSQQALPAELVLALQRAATACATGQPHKTADAVTAALACARAHRYC